MTELISDPNAMTLLIFGLVLIVGLLGMRMQDKFEKKRASNEQ